jgi:hypothetical protein
MMLFAQKIIIYNLIDYYCSFRAAAAAAAAAIARIWC